MHEWRAVVYVTILLEIALMSSRTAANTDGEWEDFYVQIVC